MIKIVHLITDLATGGAEVMLLKLLSRLDRRFSSLVVSVTDAGTLGSSIEALGIPVVTLGMRRGRPSARGLWALIRLLRKERPQILQTWLYHADLLGLVAGKVAGVPLLVWNVRCSNMEMRDYRPLSGWVIRLLAFLSTWPDLVIVNSEAGRQFHEQVGYRPKRWAVIPNGFDLERFASDPGARQKLRAELGLPGHARLIGMVARYDPMKDHATFLRAIKLVLASSTDVHVVLVGLGMEHGNRELTGMIEDLGVGAHVHLLGERNDVPAILAALDIATLSSAYGEGLPNVVGEAMACGVPCVVTDVGDSAVLVGDTGKVVPPRNPEALATALAELIDLGPDGRRRLGDAARQRIKAQFDLDTIVKQYERCYDELAAAAARAKG